MRSHGQAQRRRAITLGRRQRRTQRQITGFHRTQIWRHTRILYSLSDVDDRPFLVDDKGSGFIALIVAINNDPLGNTLKNQVWIHKMDKATGTWDTLPAQEVKLPDKPPYGEGHYYYNSYWPPNGAINLAAATVYSPYFMAMVFIHTMIKR